jgi:hypothetical protein
MRAKAFAHAFKTDSHDVVASIDFSRLYTPGHFEMIRLFFAAGVLSVSLVSTANAAETKAPPLHTERFELPQEAEVVATLTAGCLGCDWGVAGREAAVLRLEVDGHYSQHLFLTRGLEAEYRVLLGPLTRGVHTVTVALDPKASAKSAGPVKVLKVSLLPLPVAHPENAAIALAPILYARPNTLGRFTDLPLLMWYEREKTADGFRLRYSVVFSNEDGGTPADRLLATWGRLTDIEYVYGIEFDERGQVLEETYQGKDHKIIPFRGAREGRHPLLYVVTDNNMVTDQGKSPQRYAPAPIPFDLTGVSREKVMDENPWTYAVTAQEARREGRVVPSPAPGSKKIVDPRRYAVIEACAAKEDAAIATFTLSLGVSSPGGGTRYFDSTGGVSEFRISRAPDNFPNGCFRGAVALPEGVTAGDVSSLQVRAHTRPPKKGEKATPPPVGPARLRRINHLFLMDPHDQPGPNVFAWTGDEALVLDGKPVTLDIQPTRK